MIDVHSKSTRSKNMRSIKSKDTKPELLLRRALHKAGYRYLTHLKELAGKPDIVFTKRKKIVFVHGCFWHKHSCKVGHIPKTHLDYWGPKLQRNVERQAASEATLLADGWKVLVVWECELKEFETTLQRVIDFLGPIKS